MCHWLLIIYSNMCFKFTNHLNLVSFCIFKTDVRSKVPNRIFKAKHKLNLCRPIKYSHIIKENKGYIK